MITYPPSAVHDTGPAQLSQGVQNPRTAHTDRGAIADGLELDPVADQPDVLDCARRCPHPTGDVGPFEGRPRRTGKAGHPPPMHQTDLGVGADIQQQSSITSVSDVRCQERGYVVRSHVPGDVRQEMDVGPRRDRQPQIACLDVQRRRHSRHVGRLSQRSHRQPDEQVMHSRIADDHGLDDVRGLGLHLGGHLDHRLAQGRDDQLLQVLCPFGGLLGVGDAGDHVLPVGDLGVHHSPCRQRLSRQQVQQIDGDLGRAQVHGQP